MSKKIFACAIIIFFLVFLLAILISEILSQPAPKLPPRPDKVRAQIQASRDLGINGFMLWNVSNNFTIEVFE